MTKQNSYTVETYFKNPETGETGWEIKNPTVYANNKAEAAKLIKAMPHFDCFIDYTFDKFND